MAKRIYQVGEPCDDCGTPTVAGKGGTGYCKPCYVKWAEANKQKQPPQQQYVPTPQPTRDFDAEARGKVRHGLICAFIQGKSVKEISEQFSDFKVKLLLPLEQLVMGKTKAESAAGIAPRPIPPAELPTINVDDEEINVDAIPF